MERGEARARADSQRGRGLVRAPVGVTCGLAALLALESHVPRRQAVGETPMRRLNARLKASSDS